LTEVLLCKLHEEYVSCRLQDGRTKDETAYLVRKYFREHGSLEGCPYNYNKTF